MEFIWNLLSKYYDEEKTNILLLILTSIILSILQTNVISSFNAKIINSLHERNFIDGISHFKWFMVLWIIYILITRVYKLHQNHILTKLRQWIRFKITESLMISNNLALSNMNFTKLSAPISRVSTTCFSLASDIMSYIIPNLGFIIISLFFLFSYSIQLGLIFTVGNILWILLLKCYLNKLRVLSQTYESSSVKTETYLAEILNNMDKVIVRGQYNFENKSFKLLMTDTINNAQNYYSTVSNIMLGTDLIIIVTIFACIAYSMNMLKEKTISATSFITLFTLLILFREKVTTIAIQTADFVELYGRTEAVVHWFKDFDMFVQDEDIIYDDVDLPFNKIKFTNVSFKYPNTEDFIFEDKSLEMNTIDHNIIGITGLSGKGKSTIMKIILKLYPITSGEITIDDHSIATLDPVYLRNNMTYINQNSRLFDKTIIDNIMYGCSDEDVCKNHYEKIMSFPRIVELFKEQDLTNDTVGFSGEKISGGQRQMVNIISGLVNPSKILILDEPTNALDKKLKLELLEIIKYFKNFKQAIVIITHDSDVTPLFDEHIKV